VKLALFILTTTFALKAAPVTALRFSPDGKYLLTGRTRAIEVRAVVGKEKARKIPCGFDKIMALTFSSEGKSLAVAGGTPGDVGGVHLLDWPSGKVIGKWDVFEDVATCVEFGVAANILAGSADSSILLLDQRREDRVIRRFEGHTKAVRGLALVPGGKMLVSVSSDRTLKSWNYLTGKVERSLGHHLGPVHAVVFRPGAAIASCATVSDDKTVRLWQPTIGRMVRIVRGHGGPIFSVAFSLDGTRMFSIGREGIGRIIDADSDKVLHQWHAHKDWAYALAVGSGGHLATGDWRGEVKLWRVMGDKVEKP